jgi:excisionase family DNA binding protein
MERLLNATEVAGRLGVVVNTIYKWCDEGRLPYIDLGEGKKRCLRFRPEAIEEMLAARERCIKHGNGKRI